MGRATALTRGDGAPNWRESDRLAALRGYGILDTPREPAFDELTRVAALVCKAPISVVNLIEETRQFFKSEIGLGVRETPVDISICAHAILQSELFVVPDTTADPRFSCNPLVTGAPYLRFYAGALIETPEGLPLGTVCVLDYQPRPEGVTPEQGEILMSLARAAMAQIELRRSNAALAESEARFRAIADSVDPMIWSTRPDGFHDYYNKRWYEYTGVPEGSTDGEAWNGMFHPDDRERAWATWRRSLATGEPYHIEYRLRHCSGSYRWVLGRAQAVRDDAGRITRWFGTCTDIHDAKEAAAANARLAAIVSTSPDAIVSFAAGSGRILTWNRGAQEMFGYTAEEAVGAPAGLLVSPDHLEPEEDSTGVFNAAMMRGGFSLETRRRRKDGRMVHVAVTATPMRDEAGQVLGISAIFRDIGERKRAEERQQLLTRELHHRIKNTLATVQAIAGSTARSAGNLEEFRHRFAERLISMGRTHTLVTENAWQGAGLRDLLRLELEPYAEGPEDRVVLDGPEVFLPAETALALGLGFHELSTNAAKYGALALPEGSLAVSWDVESAESAGRLTLTWIERNGPPVSAPTRQGFGSQLLQRVLGTQVGGTVSVSYPTQGVRVEIELPLDDAPKPNGLFGAP